jgi:hypothetical protein
MDKKVKLTSASVDQLLQIIRYEACSMKVKRAAYQELSKRYFHTEVACS